MEMMNIKLFFVNFLTLIRLVGSIILIPIYFKCGGFVVAIISMCCYITDFIDGFLARKWKVATFFGAAFDGIADKLLVIINCILLYLITPYALIPIMFEILTLIVNIFKYKKNYNIKSNKVGKLKVWILAVCTVSTFVISDISIFKVPNKEYYFWLLIPAIIIEMLTFISYSLELFNNEVIITENKVKKTKGKEHIKSVWLSPEFYYKHKNDTNLKDLKKNSKLK